MNIQKVFAATKRDAIEEVRRRLGRDAIILSDRRTGDGVEMVAASGYDEELIRSTFGSAGGAGSETGPGRAGDASGEDGPASAKQMRVTAARPGGVAGLFAFGEPSTAEVRERAARAGESPREAGAPAGDPAVREELRSLRALVENHLSGLAWNETVREQPYRAALLRGLLGFGVGEDLCRVLADACVGEPSLAGAWRAALDELIGRVPLDGPKVLDRGGVVALVGPTGAGKTTTAAKLAGQFLLRNGPGTVGFITTDDYRLGAQEQLLAFGRILDAPVLHARDQSELRSCVKSLEGCPLVLIDTEGLKLNAHPAGESPEAAAGERFLYSELALVYVAIPAGIPASAAARAMRALSAEALHGCVVTKVDECPSLGSVLCNAIRHELPLAYVADGQQVPRDLHLADRKDLAGIADNPVEPDAVPSPDDEVLASAFSQLRTRTHV